MENNIWAQCHGQNHMVSLQETAWRMVEAQHILATRKLVDSVAEQELIEELIDAVKPKPFGKEFTGLHFLLYTPFCYPPLKYGSRFGNRSERSLWYGALQLTTAMAEKAFYQFIFLQASAATFGIVERTFTAFSTSIKTARGINLIQPPFAKHSKKISSPSHYQISQTLGTAMRRVNIEAFCYQSARDKHGTNIALFSPKAFLHKKPNVGSFQTWQCIVGDNTVEFMRTSVLEREFIAFTLETFQIAGELPFAAN